MHTWLRESTYRWKERSQNLGCKLCPSEVELTENRELPHWQLGFLVHLCWPGALRRNGGRVGKMASRVFIVAVLIDHVRLGNDGRRQDLKSLQPGKIQIGPGIDHDCRESVDDDKSVLKN
jgi:hypothetical protein